MNDNIQSIHSATWNRRFMALAAEVATWSKDPDCKVGALIVSPDRRVVATGYNGFPTGVPDRYEGDKDEKNAITIHAELNAILNAKTDLAGFTLYSTKDPCLECCKAIIQAGIKQVVVPQQRQTSSNWAASQSAGALMLSNLDVLIVRLF